MHKQRIINKLNNILASERRQAMIYRRCAQVLTGPGRDSLAHEFMEHADDEDKHAEVAMRHIIALDGDVDTSVKEAPVWNTTKQILEGLLDYELQGVALWLDLLESLEETDAFRYQVEDVLAAEQHHYDETKRWQRDGYTEKSYMGDYGSKKPLNWKTPPLKEFALPTPSHEERLAVYARHGTPPTRAGMVKGLMPNLRPGLPDELNPPLHLEGLEKALLQPIKTGPSGRKELPRKRDPHGRFTEAPTAGKQSAADEDAASQEREAKLSSAKERDKLRPEWKDPDPGHRQARLEGERKAPQSKEVSRKALPINMPNEISSGNQAQQAMPVGQTPSGKPIYDDPYHPDHSQFGADDHLAAAQIHRQKADGAQSSGDMNTYNTCMQNAAVHEQMAQDNQSPMQRANNMFAQKGMNPFDWFFQQNHPVQPAQPTVGMQNQPLPVQQPGMPSNMQGMPGQFPDQNKPLMNPVMQGPKPGMMNTFTGTGVGPQTQEAQPFAGTDQQMQGMPPAQTEYQGPQTQIANNVLPDSGPDDSAVDDSQFGPDLNEGDDGGDMSMLETGQEDTSMDAGPSMESESGSENPFGESEDSEEDSSKEASDDDNSDTDTGSASGNSSDSPKHAFKSLEMWLKKRK